MASAARHSPVRQQPMGGGGRGRHASPARRGGASAGAARAAGGHRGQAGTPRSPPSLEPRTRTVGTPLLYPPAERTGSKPAREHAGMELGAHPAKSPSSHRSLCDGSAGLPRARVTHSAPAPLLLYERVRKNQKIRDVPAAVPQHGGTHQAEEKRVEITSSGNKVTFRWICSKFSTSAMKAPTTKSTTLLCTRC